MEKIALDFEKGNGLIPTVIQDYESNEDVGEAYGKLVEMGYGIKK